MIIANPPYNAGQVNESDNNKNRKYPVIDRRISETYGKRSQATLLRKLQDPYLKAIRWATDRIGIDGIVCLVTNGSFIDDRSLDGVRDSLGREFDQVYVLDLGGNVRKNPKLSGTTHNVFGIQVGVSINLFVRKTGGEKDACCPIRYTSVDLAWRKEQKYDFLNRVGDFRGVTWDTVKPDANHTWITQGLRPDFGGYLGLIGGSGGQQIFSLNSLGISTNRDAVAYAFQKAQLEQTIREFLDAYNVEVIRYQQAGKPKDLDEFLKKSKIKWSETLKAKAKRGRIGDFIAGAAGKTLYRPFTTKCLYYDDTLVDRPGAFARIFPEHHQDRNLLMALTDVAGRSPFSVLASEYPVDLHLCSTTDAFQCFPFYTYAEDGTHRRENITDWALEQFRTHYQDRSTTKWDIFHYIYAVLHHPEYRARYAANLRHELPHVPFASVAPARSVMKDFEVFSSLAKAGRRLVEVHVHYERQPEYPLTKKEKAGEKLDYRVTKMKLSKDKTALIYNQFLTLSDIPKETYEYRLGNRSALEWVIDQYQVSIDKRSGISNDPNRPDDPTYILRLIGQIVTVSLETVEIVGSLPSLGLEQD